MVRNGIETQEKKKSDAPRSIHTWRLASKTCAPQERASIARPVVDVCVDDVEVKGEDVLAHGGGFGFGLVGQSLFKVV